MKLDIRKINLRWAVGKYSHLWTEFCYTTLGRAKSAFSTLFNSNSV